MRVIKIEESKADKMYELAEKSLKSMGKLMQCLEDMSEDGYGERDDEDDDDDYDYEGSREGMRRGRSGNREGMRRKRYMR